MSVHLSWRGYLAVLATSILVACGSSRATAQLIYQESFETDGDGARYTLTDRGHEDTNLPNQASGWGIWGHNFDAEPSEIGLVSTAPNKRAAILWNHEDPVNDMADIVTEEALALWVSLVNWAIDDKQNAKIGIFPSTFPLGVELVANTLEREGHTIEEIFTVDEVSEDLDLLIHSSETGSPSFTEVAAPVISFSPGDHDDLAVTQIGQTVEFFDPVELTVPDSAAGHPALGGLTGTIPFTTDAVQLQTLGNVHNGGTTLATVIYEDPNTGDEVEGAALFVIEKGDPLLGAFNPDPEGDGYVIGAALNKFGDGEEKLLTLAPIDISGRDSLKLRVALAATAADFENDDYLRIDAKIDNGETVILEEFFGVDDQQSDCHKGLSNGEFAGEVGEICLPTEAFGDFTFDIPNGDSLVLSFAARTTWGNELVGIDNIRVFSGALLDGDYNGDGLRDANDLDLQATAMASDSPDLPKYDHSQDGQVNFDDRLTWVRDFEGTWIGDADLNGEFNSGDFVAVFTAGKYESGEDAGWSEGDWDGNGLFDSGDFVAAFTDGGYEKGPLPAAAAIPEPSSATIILVGLAMMAARYRRRLATIGTFEK